VRTDIHEQFRLIHVLPPLSLRQVNPLPALLPPAHQNLLRTGGLNRTTTIRPWAEECIRTRRSLTSAAAIASTRTLGDTVGNMALSYGLSTTDDAVRIQKQTPPHFFSSKMTPPLTTSSRSIGFNKGWRGVDELVDGFVWAHRILHQKCSGFGVNLLSPRLTVVCERVR
jgi:hypothetical protein